MTNLELFINWNKALYSYFFLDNTDDEEVSLYIDKEKIEEIGAINELGGYDSFMSLIMLSLEDRQSLYLEIRQLYLGTQMTAEQRSLYRSNNLFNYARVFIDNNLYTHIDCPFLIYIVFVVLMGSECYRNNRAAIGGYITEILRQHFPNHDSRRSSLENLFNELSRRYPRFCARKLTEHPYVGLIRYQLGLSNTQAEQLRKALYCADLSDDLPYEEQVRILSDYVDNPLRDILRRKSLRDVVLKRRISDLIDNFDPQIYEQTHQVEEITSKGKFVLAVYEDEYSEKNDRLVLLTDVNNKSLAANNLRIEKGTLDRLGEYAQYNINHVLINNCDKAEMRAYTLNDGENNVRSVVLGNRVLFSRSGSNYLIQTDHPQKGKDTYILVKHGHQDSFEEWLSSIGSPSIVKSTNTTYVHQVFGEGWDMYVSSELDVPYTHLQIANQNSTISMNGGMLCPGKYKVYQFNALPYFEFPEMINLDRLSIYINLDDRNLNDDEYSIKILDDTKLVIELIHPFVGDTSQEMDITFEYTKVSNKTISFHESIFISDQEMKYKENDLLAINLWGQVATIEENAPVMKGYIINQEQRIKLHPSTSHIQVNGTLDIFDRRFYLVNLIASRCCMRDRLLITDKQLQKCIRYAATQYGISTTSGSSVYRDLRYLLVNCGFINADYDNHRYQLMPPTFIKIPNATIGNAMMYMLAGCYTFKFLQDLKDYCSRKNVQIFVHDTIGNNDIDNLLPPVLLLQYSFDAQDFMQTHGHRCEYTDVDDVAVSILDSLPNYRNYEESLRYVSRDVFNTRLTAPSDSGFPRIRYSALTGYGASQWIEKANDQFYRINIPDLAWAHLYCLYKRKDRILIKGPNSISIAQRLHLPVMMQRALYLTNLGRPSLQKAFICHNNDANDIYYNVIKLYDVSNAANRMPHIVKAITGHADNENNPSVRSKINCRNYKLTLWYNKSKHSDFPRSLMVINDQTGTCGFVIRTEESMKTFLRKSANDDAYTLVDSDEMNRIVSLFMTSRKTYEELGITFKQEMAQLPPEELYETEEIQII